MTQYTLSAGLFSGTKKFFLFWIEYCGGTQTVQRAIRARLYLNWTSVSNSCCLCSKTEELLSPCVSPAAKVYRVGKLTMFSYRFEISTQTINKIFILGYNVMSAKENQAAAKQTFDFHALINEHASDEVRQRVRSTGM